MKHNKFLSVILVAGALLTAVPDVFSGSIGRSSSSSSHSSSSVSHSSSSSVSKPSAPAAAPAPSKQGGIGGTQASVGVRKSEVTAPVAQKVEQSKAPAQSAPTSNSTQAAGTSAPGGYTQPHVGYAPTPQPVIVHQSSGFGSSFAGALGGSMLGNALFNNNHGGGTTVVNNGGGYAQPQPAAQAGGVAGGTVESGSYTVAAQPAVKPKEEYGMWHFMFDLITFVILAALVVGIAWVFYKGYKMVKAYVDRERGVDANQPFSPTAQFWTIQKAFAAADVTSLKNLLGPDLVDELTLDLQPSEITLHNVSHEVRLSNPREFSVWYTFEDAGAKINQVWHYEKFNGVWHLNGIENV